MSPSAALASDIFLTYVKLAIALLGGAGVLLVIVTYGLKRQIGGVWRTYVGWLFMDWISDGHAATLAARSFSTMSRAASTSLWSSSFSSLS